MALIPVAEALDRLLAGAAPLPGESVPLAEAMDRVLAEPILALRTQPLFEGIEESWQLELAEQSGASMVQGFALARPQIVPADFHAFGSSGEAATDKGKVAQAEPEAGEAPATRPQKPARAFGRRIVP